MAIISSHIWSTARGSVGGITYLTTPSGQIIARQRTIPVNPNTSQQTVIRSCFAGEVQQYALLSTLQQDLWDTYAEFLGQGKTGRQTYLANVTLARYMNQLAAGQPAFGRDAPLTPVSFDIQNVGVATPVSAAFTGIAMSSTNDTGYDGDVLSNWQGPFNSARARFKGPWGPGNQQVDAIPDAASTLVEIATPGLNAGDIVFSWHRFCSDAPHRISAVYILRHSVVVNP